MTQDDPERKLDAWLDDALARYSAAEPRPGLERRVLESLGAQTRRTPRRWWKAWAPALATAAAAAIVVVVVLSRSPEVPVVAQNTTAQPPATASGQASGTEPMGTTKESAGAVPAGRPSPREPSGAATAPEVTNMAAGVTPGPGAPGLPKARPGGAHHIRSASKGIAGAPIGSVFPLPAPLSEQERLAMVALQQGLLAAPRPGIPPGDELLPQVAIQDVEIRPIQDIKPIGTEGL